MNWYDFFNCGESGKFLWSLSGGWVFSIAGQYVVVKKSALLLYKCRQSPLNVSISVSYELIFRVGLGSKYPK